MTDAGSKSLERLRKFTEGLSSGQLVDPASGLTADDLHTILEEMDVHLGNVIRHRSPSDATPPATNELHALASLVSALMSSTARMGRYFNARIDNEADHVVKHFHEAWNEALAEQAKAIKLFGHAIGNKG